MSEQHQFTSDISSLMSLIINTFYSSRDIFLRELISNASDAIDKVRHASLTDKSAIETEENLRIRIIPNKEEGTLTIHDTGCGMTKTELINNLSCIAHSGTKEFMEAVEQGAADDVSLIGQFGVGFFSGYLVADQIDVISKSNEDETLKWTSTAQAGFTIEETSDEDLDNSRGTKIVLHLKEDQHEYLEESKIEELVKKHSEFVQWPIELLTTKEEEIEVEAEEAAEKDEDAVEEVDEAEEKETITQTVTEFKHLNVQDAIWTRPKDEITEEEYNAFYKSISNDYQDALAYKHISFEGSVNFRAIIYIPKAAPFEMFKTDKKNRNFKLYVRRVFISDDSEELVPEWLSFVKGIVDSDDLPLNISREMLQVNPVMRTIRKQLVKKSIELFNEVAEDEEKFKTFNTAFGKNIKFGVHSDTDNAQKLAKLLRYFSTRATETETSLEDYVVAMKEGQKNIYYLTGETRTAIENSPFIEALKEAGFEVLFLTEPIDEYAISSLREFEHEGEKYKLVCASKEGLELEQTEEQKQALEKAKADLADLTAFMTTTLGSSVEKVVVSNRIVDSPCVISTGEHGWSANMERIIRAQALSDDTMLQYMSSKKTLEINPSNAIIKSLAAKLAADENDATIPETVKLLYETCLLVSGFPVETPVDYAGRIYRMVNAGLGIATEMPAVSEITDAEEQVEDEDSLEEVD